MNLFKQKIILVATILIVYILITLGFVIYPKYNCTRYALANFFTHHDTLVCNVLRYALFVYYIVQILIIFLVITACYIKKMQKISNPYYMTKIKPERKLVLVFIPVYSEDPDSLKKTFDSVVTSDYESKIMFIVVDGKVQGSGNDKSTDQYTLDILCPETNVVDDQGNQIYTGLYNDVFYILFIKQRNAGKKDSFLRVQNTLYKCTFDRSHFLYDILSEVVFVMMLDTDTIIENTGITTLIDYLESNPYASGACGETCITNKNKNIITMSQVYEYWITHYTLKSLESVYGNVLVLSGCFSMYRKNIIIDHDLVKNYGNEKDDSLYNANITKLGEDRFFTNLMLQMYPELNTVYIEKAKCFTNAPESLSTLFSQRRRWSNSLIFCNIMLISAPPKYDLFKKSRFMFICILELWISLIMPLMMCIGYYYMIAFEWSSVIFLLWPTIMCVVLFKLEMVLYSIPFILLLPIYSICIPVYSIFCTDNVTWGSTRKTDPGVTPVH